MSVHALLPPDTTELLYADLASMRRAPFYSVIAESLDAWSASMERIAATTGREAGIPFGEIMERTDWMLFSNASGDPVVFVAARLSEEQVKALLETIGMLEDVSGSSFPLPVALLSSAGGGANASENGTSVPTRGEIASRPAWIATRHAALEITPGLWVFAPRARVEEVLVRAEGASPVEARTAATDRRLGIFRHHVAGSFARPDRLRQFVVDEEDGEELPGWIRSIRSAGFTFDLSDGARVGVLLTTSGANASWLVERELRTGLAAGEGAPLARLFGFSSLLRDIRVNAEGEEVRLDVALGARDAALHWGRISGVAGAALFIVEAFADVVAPLSGLSLADEGDELDWGDAGGGEGRSIDFVVEVIAVMGNAPATVGERCVVSLTRIDWNTCWATVRCGERLLYGHEADGPSLLMCVDDEDGLVARDASDSDEDGDPQLALNASLGSFSMGDMGHNLEPSDQWLLSARIVESSDGALWD